MSFVLPKLQTKKEIDNAIKSTEDRVLVLRFGKDDESVTMQLDDIVSENIVYPILILYLVKSMQSWFKH